MCADGIEIAQERNVPAVICTIEIFEHLFLHEFCRPVRIGRHQTAILIEREPLGLAVHRCRGREDEIAHTELFHRLQKHKRRDQIVIVVEDGFLHALAHRLEPRKVDDPIDVVRRENFFEFRAVAYVCDIEIK